MPPTLRVSPLARSKVSHQTCTSSSAGTLRYVFLFLWYALSVITRSSSCTWPCSGSSQGSWESQWWPGDEAWTHHEVWNLQNTAVVIFANYWRIEYWANYCNVEYWMKYCGIEILDEKPRFHQQDQSSRSCSSAPQSSRFLKRLPPEQKLWKPCVKNTLKVFYSSITAIKDFHFGSKKKVSLTATQAVRTTRKFILRILFEDSTSPQAKCLFKAPTHHAQVYPDSVDKKDDKKSLEAF